MLLGNYSNLNSSPGRNIGGGTNPYDWMKVSNMMKFYYGEATIIDVTNKSSFNNGYIPPYSWTLAPNAGGMAMSITGSGGITVSLIPQYPMLIGLIGDGTLNATASLLVGMLCNLIGSGILAANISGIGGISSNLTGSGTLSADIKAYANLLINLLGSGILNANIQAIADMHIDIIVSGAGLSTSNVGKAVWEAILNQFDTDPESAAAKLLAAGSAGDPWSTNLPASYTGTQAGALLAEIKRLTERLHRLGKLDPANPLTVTPSTMIAGNIHVDITGDGETSSTFTSTN